MKTILIPIDFSKVSDAQIKYAQDRVPQAANTLITLVHVAPPLEAISSFDSSSATFIPPPQHDHNRMKLQLEAYADTFREQLPDIAITCTVLVGHPVEALGREVMDETYDEIIIGSHGHGALHDMFLGSVANKILRKATCEVHVIPSREPEVNRHERGPIVVAIDFGTETRNRIRRAVEMAVEMNGLDLVLLHVVDRFPFDIFGGQDELIKAREHHRENLVRILNDHAKAVTPPGCNLNVLPVIRFGDRLREMVEDVGERWPSVLVMGMHREGPLHDFFVGSLSRDLLNRVDVPVAFVPPAKEQLLANPVRTEERIALSKALPDLNRDIVARLLRHSKRIRVKQGDYLLQTGGAADGFHLLLTGEVALRIDGVDGAKIEIARHSAGELVGLSWLRTDPHWALDALATSPVTSLKIDTTWLMDACAEDAELAISILRTFSGVLFKRLQSVRNSLVRYQEVVV